MDTDRFPLIPRATRNIVLGALGVAVVLWLYQCDDDGTGTGSGTGGYHSGGGSHWFFGRGGSSSGGSGTSRGGFGRGGFHGFGG